MSTLPVDPNIHVVTHRDYVHNTKRWVALCVVRTEFGLGLKFYKWKWRESEQEWRVDLARFSVTDIDLCRVASDAIQWSKKYNIQLSWPSLEQIKEVDVSVQSAPFCPSCNNRDAVESVETIAHWHCSRCDEDWADLEPSALRGDL
jgi:ribosomal protein L37AE/L43A